MQRLNIHGMVRVMSLETWPQVNNRNTHYRDVRKSPVKACNLSSD